MEKKEKYTDIIHIVFWILAVCLAVFRYYFIHKAFQRGRDDVCPHFIDVDNRGSEKLRDFPRSVGVWASPRFEPRSVW